MTLHFLPQATVMILRMYTLTLEPEHPLRFSVDELRSFLNQKLAEYTTLHKENTAGYIHRYPVVQVKLVKSALMVTGISQGADCLYYLIRNQTNLGSGENICRVNLQRQGDSGGTVWCHRHHHLV